MPPISTKTPAEQYLDALQKLEDSLTSTDKAATLVRKALRLLKKSETARSVVDPKPAA